MNKLKPLLILLLACAVLCAQNSGIRVENMDKSVKPQDDFYNYCNGNWMKTFKLPESDSRYGSFNEINENNLRNIQIIYAEISNDKSAKPGTNRQKMRDFYNLAMDSMKADKLGLSPIANQLKQIDEVKTKSEFLALKSKFEMIGIRLLYASGVEVDLKNSKNHRLYLNQAGYGLPDKDFYYSERFSGLAGAYKELIANLFILSGTKKDDAVKIAESIFEWEKRILDKGKSTPEMRDVEGLYNPVAVSELNKLAPNLNSSEYLKSLGIKQPDTVVIHSREYFSTLSSLIQSADLSLLKNYAKWHLLNEAAPHLSKDFVDAKFNFYGKTLSGAKIQKARWQRVHGLINMQLGDIISEEYVGKYFPQSSKDKLNVLIDNLIAAYRERIDSRDWMDAATKKQAYLKLDLLIRKIGFPEKWEDYSELKLSNLNLWTNVCEATEFNFRKSLEDLYKPVNRQKWQMSAVTVNAYYNPTTNEITFPAAILQPPFYDASADDAANYGTMGSIIGHELSHGFDDQGSQFDASGNLKNWWSEQDLTNFKNKKQGIITQFNNYIAIDSMRVNGEMTQGENIADLGGLTMAYYAYKKSLKGNKSPMMDGFTGEQRFFIAWCQGWKSVCRDQELKRLLMVDVHSPAYFRAWAPLTNMKEFYETFDVKEGHKHFIPASNRVEIW